MKRLRFSDIPLVAKITFAPGFALVILGIIAASTVWSQQRQTAVLANVIYNDRVQNALATDAQSITAANGALYTLMSKQADGGSLADSQQALKGALDQIAEVKANLTTLGPVLPANFGGVLKDLVVYQDAVEVVGSMLGVNFHTAAAFIKPFQKNYFRMTATLNRASRQVAMASSIQAADSSRTARYVSRTMIILVTVTFLAVAMVAWIIVLAVRAGVKEICEATESLAAGDHDIDLERLERRDEFGAIVRSLAIFRGNQFRINALKTEQVVLEAEKEASRISRERLTQMIAALSETNDAILRADSREKLFQLVCEASTLGGKFTSSSILIAAPGDAFFHVVSSTGFTPDSGEVVKVPTDPALGGISAHTFHTGKPYVTVDYIVSERLKAVHASLQDALPMSVACIPLLVRDRPAGVLIFLSEDRGMFTPEYVELLQRLANNVSFSLENFDRAEEKEQAEERIRYLATHDSLTGLPNRSMFNELMSFSLKSATRYERKCAVLFIDLDRFKLINDSLGHAAGDTLLVETAARLRSVLRASDIVARLGGDEFMILLNDIVESRQAAIVAESLLSVLGDTFVLNGRECRVTASIGIAMYPDDGEDEETLMKNADSAMYSAKADGKNGARFFSSETTTQSIDHLTIEASLQHALYRQELCLHYQPKISTVSGEITGVEALLRWNHPEMGLLPPAQFIPIAEESGLIVPIGRWALRTACAQNMEWQRAGLPPVSMAVNVSPRQFSDESLLEEIDDALAVSGMEPKYLQIEITESMVMLNVERAVRVLDAIQSRGVCLAIDDFGTGYSSMSLLKRFPIDTIKIDRSFVRDLPQNGQDKAIATAIISMAKALGLKIIAEGVETIEQDEFLRGQECDEIQGFLFSKPVTADKLAEMLAVPRKIPQSSLPLREKQQKSTISLKG